MPAIRSLLLAAVALLTHFANADQGGFANAGGSASVSSGVALSAAVASPAGMLTFSCPGASPCSGGSLSFTSNDGSVIIAASFISGTYIESCSGGGRGGHTTCGYSFTGSFRGTLTTTGGTGAINGSTTQFFGSSGTGQSGTTAYNSAYTPFYYSDSAQILRADDLQGTNQIAFGTQGSGIGQFYGAYGLTTDSAGRIYVADTYNCRVVRIDNISGANWTEYDSAGGCGGGTGQLSLPTGVAVDSLGRIYIADSKNSQLIRMDDITGANWTVFSSSGGGSGQIATYTNIAVDSGLHIFVADTANKRIVRMDDLAGTNFTALTQSPSGVTFNSPVALALDPLGRIFIADNAYYAPEVIRVDDMTGANWSSIYVSATGSGGLNSIAVDNTGIVLAGGNGAKIIDNQTAVLNSSGTIAPYGSYYVFGVTPVPLPSPRPSAVSFTPSSVVFTQNAGSSTTEPITIANFGGSPLNFSGFTTGGVFSDSPACPSQLLPGTDCVISVSFAPTVAGSFTGALTVNDDSGNQGTGQTILLNGTGTAPMALFLPASLSFSSTVAGSITAAKTITVSNTGTGAMLITGILAPAQFSQTNTCASPIAPGSSCTISVAFAPTTVGTITGSFTVSSNAGTQSVSLNGTGSAPVTLSMTALSFGTVTVGTTSSAKSVTLTNRQATALTIGSIATAGGFTIATNSCTTPVAPRASCTFGVAFSPTVVGVTAGIVTISDSALGSQQTITLVGTGVKSGGSSGGGPHNHND